MTRSDITIDRETIQLLQQETPDFISPDLCPPNSPDLNPVTCQNVGTDAGTCHRRSSWSVEKARRRKDITWN